MEYKEAKRIQKLKDFNMKPPLMARQMVADFQVELMFGHLQEGTGIFKPLSKLERKWVEKKRDRIVTEIVVDALPDPTPYLEIE